MAQPDNPRILLIISGSVAAYKALELVRRLRERKIEVTGILTKGGQEFITPLAVSALSGTTTYSDLFSLKDETEMGHIHLARTADMVVVAPASADIIAKMACGIADSLATATLLARDRNKKLLLAPAMNVKMWQHPATQRNIRQIRDDGAVIIPPASGDLACGENGEGRMADVEVIVENINQHLHSLSASDTLDGYSALVTAGPTYEPLDPVRFIGNHSSGKQGYAIAQSLADAGAQVTLISGHTNLQPPANVKFVAVTTAEEMLAACKRALPVDIAVCAAAVADWKAAEIKTTKMKKDEANTAPDIRLVPNPDILQYLATDSKQRPALVIGFAAETEDEDGDLLARAHAKLQRKSCDWIIANNVTRGAVFGADNTSAWLLCRDDNGGGGNDMGDMGNMGNEWSNISKTELARQLAAKIAGFFAQEKCDGRDIA